jgi:hypothetical protein
VVAGLGKEDRMTRGSYLALRDQRAQQRRNEQKKGSPQDGAGSEYLPDFLK